MKHREKELGVAIDRLKLPRRPLAITAAGKKTCTGQCASCPKQQKKQTI